MKSIFLWILLLLIIFYIITNLKMYEGWTENPFVDYPGNDIIKMTNVYKPACDNTCKNVFKNCIGYVKNFRTGWGPGTCWLKSKFDINNAKVDTGKVLHIK
jgi:hypothetical protein